MQIELLPAQQAYLDEVARIEAEHQRLERQEVWISLVISGGLLVFLATCALVAA